MWKRWQSIGTMAGRKSQSSMCTFIRAAKRSLGTSPPGGLAKIDRKSTRLNSSHLVISYAVFCLKKKIFEHSWDQERRRLDVLEQFFDAARRYCLGRVPLPPCWGLVSLVAGGGSLSLWISAHVVT